MDKWEKYLIDTNQKNYNLEKLNSIKENNKKLVYKYVQRSLNILDKKHLNKELYFYVRETLRWMDVAKGGDSKTRKLWKQKGYDLFVHNIGSSEIYKDDNKDYNEVVRVLIKTHGLIGQYLRGENRLDENIELYELISKNLISKEDLKEVLIVLNECVVAASSKEVYEKIKDDINEVIDWIVNNDFNHELNIIERIDKLNGGISKEDKIELTKILKDKRVEERLNELLNDVSFWYYQVAIGDFSILEQIKILMICALNIKDIKDITFSNMMKSIYLDYKGTKAINIFKKRIIEEYLKT